MRAIAASKSMIISFGDGAGSLPAPQSLRQVSGFLYPWAYTGLFGVPQGAGAHTGHAAIEGLDPSGPAVAPRRSGSATDHRVRQPVHNQDEQLPSWSLPGLPAMGNDGSPVEVGRGRHVRRLVGARGLEPPASGSQSRRATRLRHAPKSYGHLSGPLPRQGGMGQSPPLPGTVMEGAPGWQGLGREPEFRAWRGWLAGRQPAFCSPLD